MKQCLHRQKKCLKKNEVPIINETDLDIKFFDDYAVADTNALNSVIDKWKESSKQKTIKKKLKTIF